MRALVAAAGVLVMGCGAKAPEPMPVVTEVPHHSQPVQGFAPQMLRFQRPELAVVEPRPDVSEEPRWPLTMMEHPALEPRFNVAGALAEPGISWTELCARGVHHRHDPSRMDELDYLTAWCAAEQHDIRTALATLAPLMRSAVPGIANGTPLDMVDVLVANEDAEHATKDLTDLQLRDAHLWDLLAAAYFEIGKNDDAVTATSTAIQLDPRATPAVTCHRIARMVLLGPDAPRKLLLDQLTGMTRDPKHVDPTCEYLAAAIPCSVDNECERYYRNQNFVGNAVYLALQYDRWDKARDSSGWIDYAWEARHLFPETGAQELVLAALDAAVISGGCTDDALANIARSADAMALDAFGAALLPKTLWIHDLAAHHDKCRAFRKQWLAAHPQ